MTGTSQDRNRPSSRLDSEGEEEEDDTDKVKTAYLLTAIINFFQNYL